MYFDGHRLVYFLMFQTKDGKDTAWATRFTITDEKGNHGTLHPTIPPGGKINPGGVGAIVPAPKKKGAPKAGAPAKAPPANAPANAPKPKPVPQAVSDKQTEKSAGEAWERVANNPSLDHVDASSNNKVASAGVPNAAPWFSMVMGAVVVGTIVLSML